MRAPQIAEEEVPTPIASRAERKLWAMVMIRAIKDMLGTDRAASVKYQTLMQSSSLRWIKSDAYYIGSFMYVCEALGIDQPSTRKQLLHIKEKRLCRRDLEDHSSSSSPTQD
jgi:hypothetical protein